MRGNYSIKSDPSSMQRAANVIKRKISPYPGITFSDNILYNVRLTSGFNHLEAGLCMKVLMRHGWVPDICTAILWGPKAGIGCVTRVFPGAFRSMNARYACSGLADNLKW